MPTANLLVEYRETVLARSAAIALAKSPNKHNRIYVRAEPMPEKVVDAIEFDQVTARPDTRFRARSLVDRHDWCVSSLSVYHMG